MQRVKYKYALRSALFLSLLVSLFVNTVSAQNRPQVPEDYQKLFARYVDNRSISEKTLNLVDLTFNDVGRSFALIAGVSRYPNMSLTNQELQAAAEDIKKLQDYLTAYEFFDEIVVLKEGDVTTENLEFFLQTYFPSRLRKFPKSRFLLAYSGHGMTEGSSGYLLKNTAQSLSDKANSINLGVVRVFVDEVVKSGHHVLVLLNACYSGAFLRRSFGKPARLIPRNPGAHAITAGGTGERSWHIPSVGKGSVFFEKVFAGLDGRADSSGDGLIGVYELFSYLKHEVQVFTDQDQNPQVGDITIHGSKGEFSS
jgi:lysozyme